MILRLFRPQCHCPLEAQREGRDLSRISPAEMAIKRGNIPLSNLDFQGSTFGLQQKPRRFQAVRTNHTHSERPILFL